MFQDYPINELHRYEGVGGQGVVVFVDSECGVHFVRNNLAAGDDVWCGYLASELLMYILNHYIR